MNLLPRHQKNDNFNLFGLLEGRFLYRGPKKGVPEKGTKVQGDEVTKAKLRGKKEKQELLDNLQGRIDDYNIYYSVEPTKTETKMHLRMGAKTTAGVHKRVRTVPAGIEGVHYEELRFDPENPQYTHGQILKIIQKLEASKKAKNNSQYLMLKQLAKDFEETISDLEALDFLTDRARVDRLRKKHTFAIEAKELKSEMEARPAYDDALEAFKDVVGDKKNREAFKSYHSLSSYDKKEAEQLFIAFMYERTNAFRSGGFPLGPDFLEDGKKNAKNHPYIYNLFFKKEGEKILGIDVSLQEIETARLHVAQLRATVDKRTPAEEIVQAKGLQSAGVTPIDPMPSEDDVNGWLKRARQIEDNISALIKNGPNPDASSSLSWEGVAEELRIHLKHAKASHDLAKLLQLEEEVEKRFTYSEFTEAGNRQNLLEWMAQKFIKARTIADKPFGGEWNMLPPDIRRAAIYTIWQNGVAEYTKTKDGTTVYEEHMAPKYSGMLAALSTSKPFGKEKLGRHLNPKQQALIKTTYLASRVSLILEYAPNTIAVLEAWEKVQVKRAAGAKAGQSEADFSEEMDKFRGRIMGKFDAVLVERFGNLSLRDLRTRIPEARQNLADLEIFLTKAQAALKDPESDETNAFIKSITRGRYKGELAKNLEHIDTLQIVDRATLEENQQALSDLQFNFELITLNQKSKYNQLEFMGIQPQGMYKAYEHLVADKPHLRIQHWDDLWLSENEADFKKLMEVLSIVIPNDTKGGRADFFAGLRMVRAQTLSKKEPTGDQMRDQEAVLETFSYIKENIVGQESATVMDARGQKALAAKLRGQTALDQGAELAYAMWDMFTGRRGKGDLIDRGSGGVGLGIIAYVFYKYKVARIAGVLLVADKITKETRGWGLLDMTGINSVEAIEGYHLVLTQNAKKESAFEDITPDAHTAALSTMRDVPFADLMEWKKNTREDGTPRPGSSAKLPQGISLGLIRPRITWTEKDKDLEARRVLWQSLHHFFAYVGHHREDKRNIAHGEAALEERWVTIPKNLDHEPVVSSHSSAEFIKKVGFKPDDITFGFVMQAEISPYAVREAVEKTTGNKIKRAGTDFYDESSTWLRQNVTNPTWEHAGDFFKYAGKKAQATREFLTTARQELGAEIYFGKKWVKLKIDQHWYTIKGLAGDNAQLVVEGVKTVGGVLFAVDKFVVEKGTTTLRQIQTALSEEPILLDQDLRVEDIAPNPLTIGSTRTAENPPIAKFKAGIHQVGFLRAFANVTSTPAGALGTAIPKPNPNDWYYQDPVTGASYLIVEVKPSDPGTGDPTKVVADTNSTLYRDNTDNIFAALAPEARKKARRLAMDKGIPAKYLDTPGNMELMAQMDRYTPGNRKKYAFYRIAGGKERHLIERGDLPDYNQAASRGVRGYAHYHDPAHSGWAKLAASARLHIPESVRGSITAFSRFLILGPKAFELSLKSTLEVADDLAGMLRKVGFSIRIPQVSNRTFEGANQSLDMALAAAGKEGIAGASSIFFKNNNNNEAFDFSLKYSQFSRTKPHVGLLYGRRDFRPMFEIYHENPYPSTPGRYYVEMYKYYLDHYQAIGEYTATSRAIEAEISQFYPGIGLPTKGIGFQDWIDNNPIVANDYR